MKIHFYQDPGHGWIRVPKKKLEKLGIQDKVSRCSYMKGASAYLEEDCDAPKFIKALEAHGETYETIEHTTNQESRIRGYDPYSLEPRSYVVWMKNPRGDILNTFRGTIKEITRDIMETLPYPQNTIWVETIEAKHPEAPR